MTQLVFQQGGVNVPSATHCSFSASQPQRPADGRHWRVPGTIQLERDPALCGRQACILAVKTRYHTASPFDPFAEPGRSSQCSRSTQRPRQLEAQARHRDELEPERRCG